MVVVSRSHAALLTDDEDAGADCPSLPQLQGEQRGLSLEKNMPNHVNSVAASCLYRWPLLRMERMHHVVSTTSLRHFPGFTTSGKRFTCEGVALVLGPEQPPQRALSSQVLLS
jgi:hypothetical protein